MSIAEKLTAIAENEQKVYEAGAKSEYNRFWGEIQNYGNREDYAYAFKDNGAKEIMPPYPINCTSAIYMFLNCQNFVNESEISFVLINNNPSLMGLCMGCKKLVNAPKITFLNESKENVSATRIWTSAYANCINMQNCAVYLGDGSQDPSKIRNAFQNAFIGCTELVNLVFEGKGSPLYLDLSFCGKLSHESLLSLKSALMDVSGMAGDYTIKVNSNTKALLTEEESNEFSALGWTITVEEV